MEDRDIVQCFEATIEIGHRASPRATPTKEGFTHDWTVFVRGHERCDISQFVEKVVFHLHHTFANPRRVVKVPPYYVSEMGYAGFDIPIEIFFKSKKEPRKIKFNYDLFLQVYEPVRNVQCEKLTFQKPTDEFKEKLINAGGVLVLPPGETQFADLCGSPTKTESPKKHKQPLISKENVSKQMLNFSGNEKSSNSGKDKQEKIDNKSKDRDAALSRRSNSLSKMVPNPSPLPSQKRPSDSPIPSEINQTKARRISCVSSERVRCEDKQQLEEKENKDKVVNHNSSENKDESQSKYKDGKDCHKTDTRKQKSSKNSKEEKKESNLKDDKVSKFDHKTDVKDDKKIVKHDNKVENDTKEVTDGKRKVQHDKNEVINKNEVTNDKKEVKHDKKEVMNDRRDVKDDRKGQNEVKEDKKKVNEVNDDKQIKEVKDGKQEVKAKKSSSTSEIRKQDEKHKVEIEVNTDEKEKSSKCENLSSKSSSKEENDKKEKSSNRNRKSEITTNAKKSEQRKRSGSPLSALDSSLTKKRQDSITHLSKVTPMKLKEDFSHSSKTSNQIYSKSALQKLMDELEDSSADDEDKITATVDIFSQQKSVAKNAPLVESGKASPVLSCKSRKPTTPKDSIERSSTKCVSEKKSESSNINDTRNKTHKGTLQRKRSGSPVSALNDSMAKKQRVSVKQLSKVTTTVELKEDLSRSSKTSNHIYSKSALKKLMDELENSSSDDEDDITDTVDDFSQQNDKVDLSLSSDSSLPSDDDFWGEISGSDSDMDIDICPTSNISKTSNPISSKSALQILMDELKYILSDDEDVAIFSQQKSVATNSPLVESGTASPVLSWKRNSEKSDLDVKQKPNEERIKDRKEANTKENSPCNFATEGISCSEQASNGEELIQLAELKKTLMGITDLSVLQKAVKLILSTGYFEIKDTFDSDLLALNLNAIRHLESFVATKL